MSKLKTLRDLFVDELRDIYDAERQLVKALPRMVKAASSSLLTEALQDHLAVTESQVERLEQVFELVEVPPRGKKCEGMEGLLKEGSDIIKEDASEPVRDAAVIAAAQRVEHYEIAVYGTLASFARQMELDEAADLLEQSLQEEKDADATLSEIAGQINFEAEQIADEGEVKS